MAKMTIDNVTYEGTPEELREIVRSFEVDEETPEPDNLFAKGDKVRLLSGGGKFPLKDFDNGSTYTVVNPNYDHPRGLLVRIEKNDGFAGYATPEQLEKVANEDPKYKTEKRHAKVGERVLITEACDSRYGNGAVMRVERVKESTGGIWANYGTKEVYVYAAEYEVIIEEYADKPAQALSFEGADYTLVSRKAQAGDVVVFTDNTSTEVINGKAYEVTKEIGIAIRPNFAPSVYRNRYNRTESNVLVYEKVEEPLKVGDYAVVIAKISEGGYGGSVGDIVKIVKVVDEDERLPYKTVKLDGGTFGGNQWAPAKALRKATDEEVEKALAPELKVGDTVEIIDGDEARWGDLGTGIVGKITDIDHDYVGEPFEITTEDDYDRFPALALRKLSDEEIAKRERLIPEKGDIVRVTDGNKHNYGFENGAIGEVDRGDGSFSPWIRVGGETGYAAVEVIARKKDRVDVA